MKIILDESTPQKLRLLIDNRHTVATTWFLGWSGLKNGAGSYGGVESRKSSGAPPRSSSQDIHAC